VISPAAHVGDQLVEPDPSEITGALDHAGAAAWQYPAHS
jgi:hypothetical protein